MLMICTVGHQGICRHSVDITTILNQLHKGKMTIFECMGFSLFLFLVMTWCRLGARSLASLMMTFRNKIVMLKPQYFPTITHVICFLYLVAMLRRRRVWYHRADSRFAPSNWETSLQSNAVSHWLGANLESALISNVNNLLLILNI